MSNFLDDCQTPLDMNNVKHEELLDNLNSINGTIQFTMKFSDKEFSFLDILIKRGASRLWMDFYHKPANTQRGLSCSKSHLKHCVRNNLQWLDESAQ